MSQHGIDEFEDLKSVCVMTVSLFTDRFLLYSNFEENFSNTEDSSSHKPLHCLSSKL